MRGRRWHRHWTVGLLGAVLCLLAAAFAIEAKVGWYSPNGNVRVAMSSTKLLAADAPRQIAQATLPLAPVLHSRAELTLFVALAALLLLTFIPRLQLDGLAPAWSSFCAPHFFRPPPRG